jgi:hypothetical protein
VALDSVASQTAADAEGFVLNAHLQTKLIDEFAYSFSSMAAEEDSFLLPAFPPR